MKPFKPIKSQAIPLDLDHVDTDMIIPAQFLTKTDKSGYGDHLFERLKEQAPDFVFNDPQYKSASILLAGENFGCGSSREHAVWAIMQAGIQLVIAKSYSDIFYANSAKNGLLLVILEEAVVDALMRQAKADSLLLSVDLENQSIATEVETYHFDYDPFRKDCFLKGQDDLAYLLEVTA
jgi:3-isopropylmalate/(R)-2-methylmalate dehydratase small subunit